MLVGRMSIHKVPYSRTFKGTSFVHVKKRRSRANVPYLFVSVWKKGNIRLFSFPPPMFWRFCCLFQVGFTYFMNLCLPTLVKCKRMRECGKFLEKKTSDLEGKS